MRKGLIENSLENGRMTSLSDTLTVGLVLVLLFGSIALYLYTRLQQAEQKISLLESILLDLKMSTEIKSYSELPAYTMLSKDDDQNPDSSYTPFNDDDNTNCNNSEKVDSSNVKNNISSPLNNSSSTLESSNAIEITEYTSLDETLETDTKETDAKETDNKENISRIAVNYEAMTLKELQTLAKTRGITGASSMKKGPILEALKTSDRSSIIEPGSMATSSFIETSSPFLTSAESH